MGLSAPPMQPLRTLAVLLQLALVSTAAAQEIHSHLCLHGCPAGSAPTNDLLIRDIYILSSNDRSKLADWAAYRITEAGIGSHAARHWRADPWLAPHETLEPDDYAQAFAAHDFDRGHQVPLASFGATPQWAETNYLSNVTPQKSGLNRGAWARLEDAERALVRRPDVTAVFVMTGPLFEAPMPGLPRADEAHLVPSGYWKVIAIVQNETTLVAAFIMNQDTPRNAEMCGFLVSVSEVEQRSGLDFFHALPTRDQRALENVPGRLAPLLGCP